jgi:hypothetical protein
MSMSSETTAQPSSGSSLSDWRSGGFGRAEVCTIERLVGEHAAESLEAWNDYFGH